MNQGKKNRQKGYQTEAIVRERLEREGWIVSRWNNNVDITSKEIIRSIPNRFNIQPGFPDFICLKPTRQTLAGEMIPLFKIKFVECKTGGKCDPIERKKLEILSEITGCLCEIANQ